jgi:hypothetical protein
MKPTHLLVAAVAIFASAACNAEKNKDASAPGAAEAKAVKPPKGGDWTQMVTATTAGGFAMGNPNAAVKLFE